MIGVGNPWRRDDGAGPAVAAALGGASTDDPSRLLDLWDGAESVIVIDATASGAVPGTVRCFDASTPLPAGAGRSTHTYGVADAVELARELDRLPASLTLYAIEGADFGPGQGLSPAVARAAARLARQLQGDDAR